MRKLAMFAAGFSLALVNSTAFAGPPPTNITTQAPLSAQTRSYAVPAKVAFSAALSALQNMGYVDINANRDAGTISATIDSKGKTIYNVFWGLGKKKWSQTAQVLVEDVGAGSTVRLNLVASETKQRRVWGSTFSDGEPVKIATPYIDYFTQVDLEIARRGGAAQNPVLYTPDATGSVDVGGARLRPAKTLSGYCIDAGPNYVGTGAANMPDVTSARPLCGNVTAQP